MRLYLNSIEVDGRKIKILMKDDDKFISKDSYSNIFSEYKGKDITHLAEKDKVIVTEDFKNFRRIRVVKFTPNETEIKNNHIAFKVQSYFEENKEEFEKVNKVANKFIKTKMREENNNTRRNKNKPYTPYRNSREYNKNNNKDLYPVTIIAKEYGLSAMKMNELLHGLGLQYYVGKNWNVYSPLEQLALTSLNYRTSNGKRILQNVKWTSKGMLLIERLLLSYGIHKISQVKNKKEHYRRIKGFSKKKEESVKGLTQVELLRI